MSIDEKAIEEAAELGPIFTFEDHHAGTGLGREIVSKVQSLGLHCKVKPLGVWRYGDSGPFDEVFEAMGLSSKALAECVLKELKK
ncbi:MAG: hypothetical protein ABC360_02860 [Acetomicrobium sp.]